MKRLHTILLALTIVLCLLRFAWLRADFPNHSPWWLDQAKFTDEGWWANGAVRHQLTGHWEIPGDYNPALVVPVWPLLMDAVFQLSGVNLVAARAVSVLFSVATVLLVYLLVRRYSDPASAAVSALLLAASPFAFAFARLATLDTIIVFEFCLLLWLASFAGQNRRWPAVVLGALIALTLLTKTTALVLMPAVIFVWWAGTGRRFLRDFGVAGAMAASALGLYGYLVLHSRYSGDYHYFFDINALADVDLSLTGSYLRQLFDHGWWVDPILYPAALVTLFVSVISVRTLWKNPLFVAAWIALAGQAVFILRRQDDYAPRYFLPMLVPIVLITVLPLSTLRASRHLLAWLLASTLAVACARDATQTLRFLHTRQFQYWNAAQAIQAIVRKDPTAPHLLLGTSADQLSLMTGLPAINDGYSAEDLQKRVASVRPGWYIGWNDMDQDILAQLSAYRLDKVASYRVFDHNERDWLTLYRMQPAKP